MTEVLTLAMIGEMRALDKAKADTPSPRIYLPIWHMVDFTGESEEWVRENYFIHNGMVEVIL